MKKILSTTLLLSTLVVGLSGAAHATTINATASYTAVDPYGDHSGYIDLTGLVSSGSGTVALPSGNFAASGIYALGSGITMYTNKSTTVNDVVNTTVNAIGTSTPPWGINDDTYLSVYSNGQTAFTFTGGATSISFDWSTIDDYNSILVVTNAGTSYTLTGSDVLASLGLATDSHNWSKYFTLTDLAGIKEIILSSALDSFELGDIKVTAVPLPGALALFAPALLGLMGFRRKAGASA